MSATVEHMYLQLMKKTLSFSLWSEPPIPIETFNVLRPLHKRIVVEMISRIFGLIDWHVVSDRHFGEDDRNEGRKWPGYSHTMIGLKRLDNIQYTIETVLRENIAGDFIETGVWRGGACIFMRAVLAAYRIDDRKVFVADSFEGLPKPDEQWPEDKHDRLHENRFLAVSQAEVENNFRSYGLLDDQVCFLKGWFKDTLPSAPIDSLSVMRLDGDMYGSTMDALSNLYPRLSRGGFCIIDDYHAKGCGCNKAVNDFRAQHDITSPIKEIDWASIFWRKE